MVPELVFSDSFANFEREVGKLMSKRPAERGKIFMRHLRLCRPDIAAKIQSTFIDPSVHSSKLEKAMNRVREEWDTDDSGNESHADR